MKISKSVENAGLWKAPHRDFSNVLLDLNENQYVSGLLSKFIKEKLSARELFTYPNYTGLLTLLAKHCSAKSDEILLTNGADQAIDLIIRTIFSSGSRVVVPSPVFSFYYQMLDINGVVTVPVGYQNDGNTFKISTHDILAALETSDGLILCNPNNPLGIRHPEEQLIQLVNACIAFDKPVVVDECYFEYIQKSCRDTFRDAKQVFVIRSFSKYFGLAGLRLGFVLAHPSMIKQLLKVRGPWDINHVAVNAATFCLENIDALDKLADEMCHVKSEIQSFCKAHKIRAYASDTNFILIEDGYEKNISRSLRNSNIQVSSCSGYPHSFGLLNDCIRVSVPSLSDLKNFLDALLRTVSTPKGVTFS